MLSKFITPGCKLELQPVNKIGEEANENGKKIYYSRVLDVISEDRMEITMPMEQTKLILLPVDGEYEAIFYSTNLYQCSLRIIDRYKSNNMYILVVEMISSLRKHQRRDYYRYSCVLDMQLRSLEEEEVEEMEQNKAYWEPRKIPMDKGVIVDISGGGLRFTALQRYEPEKLVCCKYNLMINGKNRECEMIGKILSSKEVENKKGTYEHRVQYVNMGVNAREEIIKYIFEEERKNRRKEKGL